MRNVSPTTDPDAPITMTAATRLLILSRDGQRPHIATLHRWITRGCRGVVLESFLVGGARCTTAAFVEKFLAALNAPAETAPTRTPTRRQKDHDRADAALAASGW